MRPAPFHLQCSVAPSWLPGVCPWLLFDSCGGAAGAVVFGMQRLTPTYNMSFYKALRKPTWTPPNYTFPLVWTSLKLAQSAALWLVWKSRADKAELILPLSVFGLHLGLGNYWNVVFFGRQQLKQSLPWMAAFWASVAGVVAAFHPYSQLGAALVAPTQLWVTVAAYLNWSIVQLNTKPQ
eukprot:jgi/Astpho2/7484/e_gw1.00114.177.1_t